MRRGRKEETAGGRKKVSESLHAKSSFANVLFSFSALAMYAPPMAVILLSTYGINMELGGESRKGIKESRDKRRRSGTYIVNVALSN